MVGWSYFRDFRADRAAVFSCPAGTAGIRVRRRLGMSRRDGAGTWRQAGNLFTMPPPSSRPKSSQTTPGIAGFRGRALRHPLHGLYVRYHSNTTHSHARRPHVLTRSEDAGSVKAASNCSADANAAFLLPFRARRVRRNGLEWRGPRPVRAGRCGARCRRPPPCSVRRPFHAIA